MRIDCGKCGKRFKKAKTYTAHMPCVIKTVPEPDCTCLTRPWACPLHKRKDVVA